MIIDPVAGLGWAYGGGRPTGCLEVTTPCLDQIVLDPMLVALPLGTLTFPSCHASLGNGLGPRHRAKS
ncbi:MAG TPA: hypothetical protein DCZ69_07060 [Syntrophobacteraceae bacterium]|nr:hypothetical protein [Syntrophobacteraceae bacterium]